MLEPRPSRTFAGARPRPALFPVSSRGARSAFTRLTPLLTTALAAAAVTALCGAPATAAPFDSAAVPAARAIAQGAPVEIVKAPDLASEAELIRFDASLLPALLHSRFGERMRIAAWPVAPGVRRDVVVARHEIYAPGARVLRVDASGTSELPRSRLIFLWGSVADDAKSGISIAVDPETATIESLARTADLGQHQLRPLVPGKGGLHLLATPEGFLAGQGAGPKPQWLCGEEQLAGGAPGGARSPRQVRLPAPPEPSALVPALPETSGPITAGAGLSLATVAIDTDHEFMSLKFSDNTTNATNYVASLFAQINVMYERDLQVQLLQGTTILRTASVADPYTQQPQPSGAVSSGELLEFANYWAANEGSVKRTVTTMLSGKSPSPELAAGLAYVGTLCNQSVGYNFCQVFQIDYLAGDSIIVGHEIGHNFGSVHTHCYTPPIDQCYNAEPGCYTGPESCPAATTINGVPNVFGTIMSYCHLLGGCSTELVFHPRTVAVISPNVTAALGLCITPGTPQVTSISPNTGPVAGGTTVVISGTNFQAGDTVAIGGVAASSVNVTGTGTITAVTGAHATGAADVVVTASGGGGSGTLAGGFFYAPPPHATGFFTVAPCRVLDTRNPAGPLGGPALVAGKTRTFTIGGACGIPASATAVSANLTVIGSGGSGFVSLFPGNAMPLGTSSVSYTGIMAQTGNAVLMLATDGTASIGVLNGATNSTQLLIDVNGYFQ